MPSFAEFLLKKKPRRAASFSYVSLFSGAGIGDYGLMLSGGKCIAACEIDPNRAAVHRTNIGAKVWGNLREDKAKLIASIAPLRPDLLIATPPCQSFSTANSRRGLREDPDHASRDHRNSLFFEALEVARALRPYVVFFENVPNFLKRRIRSADGKVIGRVEEFMQASLSDYRMFTETICFSKLGVPQRRQRSIAVFLHKDVLPLPKTSLFQPEMWPAKLNDTALTILDAIGHLPPLDSATEALACNSDDPLHQVPVLEPKHYRWVSDIPPASGASSWENACPSCGDNTTPVFKVMCHACNLPMMNRPHMPELDGTIRPIKGFKTSYTRMRADTVAPTMTTASGHFSSDLKVHPTQNRVLSPRECAVLQAVPNSFTFPKEQLYRKAYLVREMVGEAVPPLVTFRLGKAITKVLAGVNRPSLRQSTQKTTDQAA